MGYLYFIVVGTVFVTLFSFLVMYHDKLLFFREKQQDQKLAEPFATRCANCNTDLALKDENPPVEGWECPKCHVLYCTSCTARPTGGSNTSSAQVSSLGTVTILDLSGDNQKRRCPKCQQIVIPWDAKRHAASIKASGPHANWTLEQYANLIVNQVTNRNPEDGLGLYSREELVRALGSEINDKWGFEGMQAAWQLVYDSSRLQGVNAIATSALSRIWDGVGEWRR